MSKITLKNLSHSYLEKQNSNVDWALRNINIDWRDGGANIIWYEDIILNIQIGRAHV